MVLCELCQTIPFTSLPPVRDGLNASCRLGEKKELPLLFYRDDDHRPIQLPDQLGFVWHHSFEALAQTAKSGCPLCNIVKTGVQIWIDHYREVQTTYPGWDQFYKKSYGFPSKQTLWLTKRFGGGDGFSVLAQNPLQGAGAIYLLTGVSFAVEADNPAASELLLRPIERDSGSKETLDIAAWLVNNCIRNHERCTIDLPPLPSRILDVDSTGDIVQLIDCSPDMRGRYISLSHCWGSSETITTTQESYEARTRGILLSHLPKTFLDAVIIARHLHIRYLWVDSLCIMQENIEDWARESGRMRDIYSNAYLVIAANHAKDGSEGCFNQRPARPESTFNVAEMGDIHAQLLYPEDEWVAGGIDFAKEPLSGRGWALQERVLARRVLHYNTRQIYLECNEGIVGEDGCKFEHRYCCNLSYLDQERKPDSLDGNAKKFKLEHDIWRSLLRSYGTRKLTKETDKLAAMSGVAKLLQSRISAEYVAGLWSDNLIEGLAWQGLADRAPVSTTQYIGPSWSWASYDGIAATGLRGDWTEIAKIEDWHVDLQNAENPLGPVKHAWIRIHGPTADLTPSKKGDTDHEVVLKQIGRTPLPRLRTKYSDDEEGKIIILDHEADKESGVWREWKMQVLLLCGKNNDKDDLSGTNYGLVIVSAADGRMKRVGWMFLEDEETKKIMEDKASWETVTLV